MSKLDPNVNSLKLNPLSVIKPEYKDPTIEDIYIVRGDEEYIYGKGYVQNYDVIVVKRITPDLVRKFAYPFSSRNEAVNFMRSLYQLNDVQAHLQEKEVIIGKDIEEEEKACTTENTKPTNKNFSFGDDDYINKQEEPQEIEPKEEKPRAKFEFGDDDEVNFRKEMHRLRDKPIPVKETNIRENKLKIDNGIF